MKKIIPIFFLFISLTGLYAQAYKVKPQEKDTALNSKVTKWIQNTNSLKFIENKGQMADMQGKMDANLLFEATEGGVNMYVTKSGLSYVFTHTTYIPRKGRSLNSPLLRMHMNKLDADSVVVKYCRADLQLLGANIRKENIVKDYESEDRTDYYLGGICPDGVIGVHNYQKITIKNIYPGIDWVIYTAAGAKASGRTGGLQYDFVVHPGADPSTIRLKYKWTDKPELERDGSLKIYTPMGDIIEGSPMSYMYNEGKSWNDTSGSNSLKSIETSYTIQSDSEICFKVNNYNKNETLIIDPPIIWATFYQDNGGSSGLEDVHGLWDDGTDVWVTGETHSPTSFPTYNPGGGAYFQATLGGNGAINVFIMEFTVAGVLKWVTDYGGGSYDMGQSIYSDGTNLWVTGNTRSTNFPVANPEGATYYQPLYGGASSGPFWEGDAFILQFSISGVRQWATYYGGSGDDAGYGICSDGAYVWVTGLTASTNFPVSNQEGASYYQSAIGGTSATNAFILQFTVAGAQEWATYYGGGGSDVGNSISSDGTHVWVTGATSSTNFPLLNLAGAYNQSALGGTGATNAFILDFTTAGTRLWATYYGGSDGSIYPDEGYSINSDSSHVWVTGETGSIDFPLLSLVGAYNQPTNKAPGSSNAFILDFTTMGARQWATYYGGTTQEIGYSIQSDGSNVWVSGMTASSDLPTLNPGGGSFFQGTLDGGAEDDFIFQCNTSAIPKWSTYYGKDNENDGVFISSDGTYVFLSGDVAAENYAYYYDTVNPGGGAYYYSSASSVENVYIVKFEINPSLIRDSIVSSTNLLCFGNNTGTATVGVKGGTPPYTYSWSPSGGTGATASGLSTGTYTITVTDNGNYSATTTVTITQPLRLLTTISSVHNVFCNGGNSGNATVTANGGTIPYTYSWSPSGGTMATATGLSAGTYTLTVTDSNGCSNTASATITQPNNLSVSASTITNILCNGTNTGIASSVPNGGTIPYTYSWSPSGGTMATASGLSAGTYTITVFDNCGASATASATITQPNSLIVTASTTTNILCYGASTGAGASTPSGGTSPYTYSWSPSGGTLVTASGLSAGKYTITVEDNCGVSGTASVIITEPTALNISVNTIDNVLCYGGSSGSVSTGASGGLSPYTYSWSNGATSSVASNLSAGTYTITVKDNNGCSVTSMASVSQPTSLSVTASVTTNVICNGASTGIILSNPSGGTSPYTYSWSPGSETGASATGLSAGTFTVMVTDNNGCSATALAAITQPASLSISAGTITNVLCNGASTGVVSSTPDGGTSPYTYSWSPGGETLETASGLSAGTYTITVKDNCGASATAIITLTQPNSLSITANTITNILCNGVNTGVVSSNPIGGTSPYTYSWSPVGGTGTTASGLSIGIYTITVTDNCGASATAMTTITQPTSLNVLAATTTNVLCNGESTGVASSSQGGGASPYTYSWSPNGGTGITATGLSAGSYTITVVDNNGCTGTASTSITQPTALIVSATSSTNVLCNGANTGIATTNTTGGTSPYTYTWSPSGGNEPIATGLSAGTYTITAKDNNGCSETATITITGINVKPEITGSDSICMGNETTLIANDTGSLGVLTYLWNTGATTSSITVSTSSIYSVVINNSACKDSISINIAVITPFVSACCDTTIRTGNSTTLTASGSVHYNWTSSPPSLIKCDTCASIIVSPTITTTYTVTGIDSLGCSVDRVITVSVESPCSDLIVPNVFTPNFAGPNGVNNLLYINTNNLDSWSIKIYDRWGKEVFNTTNQLHYWNGESEGGGHASDGVYYYVIIAVCQGESYQKDGFVQLIR